MWAQLIKVRLKPGKDLAEAAVHLRAAEQPGSGLVREMFMRDQKDPDQAYILAMFESEKKARGREQDPGSPESPAGDDGRHTRRPAGIHRSDRRRRVDGLAVSAAGTSGMVAACLARSGRLCKLACRSSHRARAGRAAERGESALLSAHVADLYPGPLFRRCLVMTRSVE